MSEKAFTETQTLRAAAVVRRSQKFRPPQTLFPVAQDGQNLISWRWSPSSIQTQFGEDRCTQFRVICRNRPTNTHAHTQTNPHIGPITIHCAAKLSAQYNNASNNEIYACILRNDADLAEFVVFLKIPRTVF